MSSSRRQYRASASLLPNEGLLPLLDILFSTIGILIVIMVVRSPSNEQAGIAYAVDGLLTCTDGKKWVFYTGANSAGITFPAREMDALFSKLANFPKLDLLVAFGATCFKMKDEFSDAFERARVTSERNTNKALKLARVAFAPLGSSPNAVQELLRRWSMDSPPKVRP